MEKLYKIAAVIGASAILIAVIGFGTLQYLKFKADQEYKDKQLKQQTEELEFEKDQEEQAERDKNFQEMMLNACLQDADDAYWSYMKLNGTEQDDGSINALTRFWDAAEKNKQSDISNCFKQYK